VIDVSSRSYFNYHAVPGNMLRRRSQRARVSCIWRTHRVGGFKLSRDPLFIEKVRDIVGLLPQSARARVWCCVSAKKSRISRARFAGSRCCRCAPVRRSGVLPTIWATAPPTCSPRSTSRRVLRSGNFIAAVGGGVPPSSLETIDHHAPPLFALHLIIDN